MYSLMLANQASSIVLVSIIWVIVLSRVEIADFTCKSNHSRHLLNTTHTRQGTTSTQVYGPNLNRTWLWYAHASRVSDLYTPYSAAAYSNILWSKTHFVYIIAVVLRRQSAFGEEPRRANLLVRGRLANWTNLKICVRLAMILQSVAAEWTLLSRMKRLWSCLIMASKSERRLPWKRVIG